MPGQPGPRVKPARATPRRIVVTLAAVVALMLGACGSTDRASPAPNSPAPSVAPTSSQAATAGPSSSPLTAEQLAALYETIEGQVVQIRGLHPKSPVNPTVLDDAGIRKITSDAFDRDNPPAVIEANQRMYAALGMLPPGASLHDLYVELLGSQVAGLYSPTDKHLYVVARSGRIGPAEKVTFSHEFTHALQDQNFDLGKLQLDAIGHGDQSLGRLALVEGDATTVMTLWQQQNLTAADNAAMLAQSMSDPSTAELLGMPAILRESLLFPYFQGASFVQGLVVSGGWAAVNAAFGSPPASTEQILHPDKYAAHEAPQAVSLPTDLAARLGTGWTRTLEDTFGEFQLQVWLGQNSAIGAGAQNAAAAGWGGDRIDVLEGPSGTWAVVLRTSWDSANDATEFETAARPIVDGLAGSGALLPGAGGTERWVVVASDDPTLARVTGTLGLAG